MFDPPEEVRDITVLPIYVWDNVLLPFVTETVRVKEPHCRKMVADLAVGESYFGMVYRWMRDRETGLPYINATGCIAKLLSNRFNRKIEIKGMARFRIVKYLETDKPYPVAEIKFFEEERYQQALYTEEELMEAVRETCATANRILGKIALETGDTRDFSFGETEFDPIEFSFLAARLFSFDEDEYLKLLNLMDPIWRFKFIRQFLEEFEEEEDAKFARKKFLKHFLDLRNNAEFN